jgi:hypothetical protein
LRRLSSDRFGHSGGAAPDDLSALSALTRGTRLETDRRLILKKRYASHLDLAPNATFSA